MWSKRRPETQKQNFASFRNKITRRKRKLSQSRATTPTQNDFLAASRLLITNGDLEPTNPNYNITISRSNSTTSNSSFNSRRRQAVRLSSTSTENGRQSMGGTTPNYILEVAKDGDILSEKIVSVNEEYRIRKNSDEGVKPNSNDENTINRKDSFSTRRRQAMKKAPSSNNTSSMLDDYQNNSVKHNFMNRSMSIPNDAHLNRSDMGIVLNLDHSFHHDHNGGNFQNDDNMTIFSLPPRYSDSFIASKFNLKNTANSTSTTKVAAHFLSSQNLSANSINNTNTNRFNDNNKRYDVISVNQSHLSSPTAQPIHSSNCATNVANSNSLLVSSSNGDMQYGVREKAASNSTSAQNQNQSTLESKKQRSVKKQKKHAKKQTNDADNVNVKKTTASANANTMETSKPAKPVKENSSENSSYLKRVKSKIYKSRSDDSDKCHSNAVAAQKQNENGSTNTATKSKIKKSKEKKTPDKSNKITKIAENSTEDEFSEVQLRHSDFPFFYRQTSNLERIRPRTFGLRSSASNVGISDLVDSTSNILKLPLEKPKLVKSKSSSAINLNLLRSRRSKVPEPARQSSKNADVEFKFMSFANISETASVSVSRKFGPNNPITIEEVPSPTAKSSERPSSWTFNDNKLKGDRPAGQPVSRSSSDKRPDAVTEEATRGTSDSHHEAEIDHDTHLHDNLHNVQRAKSSQPAINRSESYKEQSQKRRQIRERRKISDPNLSKSNDVDSDHQELSYHSGSSSNSSLSSSRSSESPQSTSLDTVPGAHGHHGHVGHQHTHSTVSSASAHASSTSYDSDLEIEPDPPDWQSSVSEDVLARLHPEEKKRQEIINELFHTERSHVRNLKVLETVFYRPLLQNKCLPSDQVRLLFPNLEEMLEIHGTFNAAMKNRRKDEDVVGDIGELLLDMFDGQEGDVLKFAVAKFCARQHFALESLKEKRRKDPRLNSFLTDCESDKLCKRLQLKDIIPTGIQRLVKYPLLFESLLKCTERVLDSTMMDSLPSSSPNTTNIPQMGPTPLEVVRIKRALERSKEILNYVNQAVKEAEDNARLQEMQKKLDLTNFVRFEHPISSEFRNVDLTKHKLIHEGPLVWRLNKQNKLSVHVVLLEEVILLFHKQDDRYILKFYSSTSQIHSPIVKMSTVLVRHNATEKESLYLVNTSQNGAQIYDLNAQSTIECKTWFKHISDAAEAYKSRERRSELCTPEPDVTSTSSSTDLTASSITAGNQSAVSSQNGDVDKASSDGGDTHSTADTESTSGVSGGDSARNSGVIDEEQAPSAGPPKIDTDNNNTPGAEGGGTSTSGTSGTGVGTGSSKREALMRLATDDQPLIQPSEVLVNVLPVHTAQPVVTPIEQVRRKDEAIRQALAEKEALVAEILQVPPEEYQTIVDMAGDISSTVDKEPTELVLAAVNQANLLSTMVSESLNLTETDTVLATSSGNPACSSQVVPTATTIVTATLTSTATATLPTIPSHRVQTVASTLNTQLTALLKVVKEREDERERMRRELHKLREQIHAMHESQTGVTTQDGAACSSDTDIFYSAGDLANIEEDP